jgi:phage terminase small subunit
MADKLTPKQEAFVRAYLETGNASEAYRRAYDAEGMKPETIKVKACELLKNGNVSVTVAKRQEKIAERHNITVDKIVRELATLGFSNMLDYMTIPADGDAFVDLSKLSREQASAIQELVVEDYKDGRGEDARDVKRIKFKLYDKKAALVDLGKHLGMFIDRSEVGKPGDFANLSDADLADQIAQEARALGLDGVAKSVKSH